MLKENGHNPLIFVHGRMISSTPRLVVSLPHDYWKGLSYVEIKDTVLVGPQHVNEAASFNMEIGHEKIRCWTTSKLLKCWLPDFAYKVCSSKSSISLRKGTTLGGSPTKKKRSFLRVTSWQSMDRDTIQKTSVKPPTRCSRSCDGVTSRPNLKQQIGKKEVIKFIADRITI